MLCSDTKAYTLNGTHVDDCRKIMSIGDSMMFGCTGKVSDNYELFEDYCECDGIRFSSHNFETSLSYNKVIKRLTSKYDKLERKFNAGKKYEICITMIRKDLKRSYLRYIMIGELRTEYSFTINQLEDRIRLQRAATFIIMLH